MNKLGTSFYYSSPFRLIYCGDATTCRPGSFKQANFAARIGQFFRCQKAGSPGTDDKYFEMHVNPVSKGFPAGQIKVVKLVPMPDNLFDSAAGVYEVLFDVTFPVAE